MYKCVYVRVVHDLIYMFFVVRSNDSFNFPLGLKYIVIVTNLYQPLLSASTVLAIIYTNMSTISTNVSSGT